MLFICCIWTDMYLNLATYDTAIIVSLNMLLNSSMPKEVAHTSHAQDVDLNNLRMWNFLQFDNLTLFLLDDNSRSISLTITSAKSFIAPESTTFLQHHTHYCQDHSSFGIFRSTTFNSAKHY